MEWIIWMVLTALIWTNNEILSQHAANKTKPTYNFWVSVAFTMTALIMWLVVRLT